VQGHPGPHVWANLLNDSIVRRRSVTFGARSPRPGETALGIVRGARYSPPVVWSSRILVVAQLAACGGGSSSAVDARPGDVATDGRLHVEDGAPTRFACTSNFGQLLGASNTYGRLDGYLVAVVPPSSMNSCNADTSHVHLQVRMNGAVYDVAVDATDGATGTDDVHTTQIVHAMPNLAWAEGWHTGVNSDYTTLGLHSTDLPFQTKQQVVNDLTADFTTTNHISVYMVTYGGDGGHLVHRNGNGRDGMIVTEPLSSPAKLRVLSFTNVVF
jgi:hypothetical protein